jgi:hypothetical protein
MVSKRRLPRRPEQVLADEVYAEIERELGLNKPSQILRKELDRSVSLFLWDDSQRTPPRAKEIRKRLNAVSEAAAILCTRLKEDPTELSIRTAMRRVTDALLESKLAAGPEFNAAVRREAEKLPDIKFKPYYLNFFEDGGAGDNFKIDDAPHDREVLQQIKWLVLREVGIDLDVIVEQLDQLCRFIVTLKRGKGGRPPDRAWNALMSDLARIFEETTGGKATVTENEHRAAAGERYSGQFVSIAAIVDRETAALRLTNVKPRSNGALGPALRRLIEPRSVRRRSKTG